MEKVGQISDSDLELMRNAGIEMAKAQAVFDFVSVHVQKTYALEQNHKLEPDGSIMAPEKQQETEG